MHKLYLSEHYHVIMPFKPKQAARERFIRYYSDLFALEGVPGPDPSTYIKANQYNYIELGDAILSICEAENILADFDFFVVTYWAHEFDPDGLFGAYFSHRYSINVRMIDVCDRGILSPIVAIHLISAFVHSGRVSKAALLCFDQTVIPVEEKFSGAVPSHGSARLIAFESTKTANAKYQVVNANLFKSLSDVREANDYTETIYITDKSLHYSCAELFTPILGKVNIFDSVEKINLLVIDCESNDIGMLSLIPQCNPETTYV